MKLSYSQIIDISLPIYQGMPIYPGNPAVAIESLRTKSSFISKLTLGSHTGTHIDVPRHVFEDGVGVDRIALSQIIGPCRVLDLTKADEAIGVDDLMAANVQPGERILVKTKNSLRGFKKFYDDYVYLDGAAAVYLGGRGITLCGIDGLSVKKRGHADVRAHTELLKRQIVIFEGVDLSHVEPGKYFFVGLPLKLVDLDGAPARAVLLR